MLFRAEDALTITVAAIYGSTLILMFLSSTLYHAISHHIGTVVGQADYASAEANVAGAARGGSDKYFRRGDGFPAPTVVLTDPGFIESKIVQPLDQLQVSFQGQGRVLTYAVKGSHKSPKGHVVG